MVQWKTLDVSDEQQNVQGYHGVKLSPTFARGRRVTLEGIIIADDHEWSSMAIDYLETLFALQSTPDVVELLPFLVTDEQDREWQLDCKVKEPLSIDITDEDYLEGTNRRWRVVLQSENPIYYNSVENTVNGDEWNFWGAKLWVKLWVALDEYLSEIQVNIEGWNIETPLEITLTATGDINTPLTIKNITTGTFFGLDIDAVSWDVIVVNSRTFVATKNGVNIKANRVEWSTWPKALWNTYFAVYDDDGGLDTSDFDVEIKYKDALL